MLKSFSLLGFYAKDLDVSISFHKTLGFESCRLFVLGGKNGVLTFDKDLQ